MLSWSTRRTVLSFSRKKSSFSVSRDLHCFSSSLNSSSECCAFHWLWKQIDSRFSSSTTVLMRSDPHSTPLHSPPSCRSFLP